MQNTTIGGGMSLNNRDFEYLVRWGKIERDGLNGNEK